MDYKIKNPDEFKLTDHAVKLLRRAKVSQEQRLKQKQDQYNVTNQVRQQKENIPKICEILTDEFASKAL